MTELINTDENLSYGVRLFACASKGDNSNFEKQQLHTK